MTGNGLPAPRFRSTPATFVVILDRFGLLNPETRDWLDRVGGGTRSREGDSALALIHHLGSVTAEDLRRQLAVDTTVAQAALRDLVEEGLVRDVRGTYYLVVAEGRQSGFSGNERRVLDELASGGTMTVHELADAIGSSANALRPVLRALVDVGAIVATAPPTSRKRAYRIASTAELRAFPSAE